MRQQCLLRWVAHALLAMAMAQSFAAHKPIEIEVDNGLPDTLSVQYSFEEQSKSSQNGTLKPGIQTFSIAANAFAGLVFVGPNQTKFSMVVRFDGSISSMMGNVCQFGQIQVTPCPHFLVVEDGDTQRIRVRLSLDGKEAPTQPISPADPPSEPGKSDAPSKDQGADDQSPDDADPSSTPTVTPAAHGAPATDQDAADQSSDDTEPSSDPTVVPATHGTSDASKEDHGSDDEGAGKSDGAPGKVAVAF